MGILKAIVLSFSLFSSNAFAKKLESGTLKNLKSIHLEQSPKVNKKLLYFWASWCPDCRGKLRTELKELKSQRPDIEILTVNLDRKEAKGKHFIEEEKLVFPVVRDEDKKLRKQLAVYSVPAWAVVEKKDENWEVLASSAGSDMKVIRKSLGAKK